MSDVADLYGLAERDPERASHILSRVLGRSFQPHESSFWGDYYLAHNNDWSEQFRLLDNFNPQTNAWNKPAYQSYPLILEVSVASLARANEIEHTLLSTNALHAVLLQRKEYPRE